MKSIFKLFISLFLTLLAVSCDRDTKEDCNNYDFVYSVSYPVDSSYAYVCYSLNNKYLPSGTSIDWSINGSSDDYTQGCNTIHTNGQFFITLTLVGPNINCSKSQEFYIDGVQGE